MSVSDDFRLTVIQLARELRSTHWLTHGCLFLSRLPECESFISSLRARHLHLVLRSDFTYGSRSLLRHRPVIEKVIGKEKKRFAIRVYEMAVVSNHIHILIKGCSRLDLQNFFRVVAGAYCSGNSVPVSDFAE